MGFPLKETPLGPRLEPALRDEGPLAIKVNPVVGYILFPLGPTMAAHEDFSLDSGSCGFSLWTPASSWSFFSYRRLTRAVAFGHFAGAKYSLEDRPFTFPLAFGPNGNEDMADPRYFIF